MVPPATQETVLLQRQISALEREVAHLKNALSLAAEEIAKRDRIITEQHWRLTVKSERW